MLTSLDYQLIEVQVNMVVATESYATVRNCKDTEYEYLSKNMYA